MNKNPITTSEIDEAIENLNLASKEWKKANPNAVEAFNKNTIKQGGNDRNTMYKSGVKSPLVSSV